ncbi:MAG: hypothetical protein ABIU58_06175 [Ramlibacter sp.]
MGAQLATARIDVLAVPNRGEHEALVPDLAYRAEQVDRLKDVGEVVGGQRIAQPARRRSQSELSWVTVQAYRLGEVAAAVDNRASTTPWSSDLAHPSPWPDKVMALLRARNPEAAIAQIKVAPSVRDLNTLQKALGAAQLAGKWPGVDTALAESLQALAAPRLHRSP